MHAKDITAEELFEQLSEEDQNKIIEYMHNMLNSEKS